MAVSFLSKSHALRVIKRVTLDQKNSVYLSSVGTGCISSSDGSSNGSNSSNGSSSNFWTSQLPPWTNHRTAVLTQSSADKSDAYSALSTSATAATSITQLSSTSQSTVTADICVVGLGGGGLAAIEGLQKLDPKLAIVGIDAGTIGAGASGNNGGFYLAGLAKFYDETIAHLGRDIAKRVYQATLDEINMQRAKHPDVYQPTGMLRLASSDEELNAECRSHYEALVADGFPAVWWDGTTSNSGRTPFAYLPNARGLYIPSDGAFQPMQRLRRLAEQVTAQGAALFEHSPMVSIESSNTSTSNSSYSSSSTNITVKTAGGGIIYCNKVLVTVDGKIETLIPELRDLGVRTARLQMLATEPYFRYSSSSKSSSSAYSNSSGTCSSTSTSSSNPVAVNGSISPLGSVMFPIPTYYRHGYEYWQQTANGCIAVGGFRDAGGENEWTQSTKPSVTIQQHLEDFLYNQLQVPRHVKITHRWGASVAFTNDGIPLIKEIRPNVYISGAYTGTGNTMSTLSGRAVAQIAMGHRNEWADLLIEARNSVANRQNK